MDIASWTGLPIEAIIILIVGYYVLEIIKTLVKSRNKDDDEPKVEEPVG